MKRTARQMSAGMQRRAREVQFSNSIALAFEPQTAPIADTSGWTINAKAVNHKGEVTEEKELSFSEFFSTISHWAVTPGVPVLVDSPAFCRIGDHDLKNQIIQMLLDGSVIIAAKPSKSLSLEFRLNR